MKTLFAPLATVLLLLVALLLPLAAAAGMLPNMAAEMADELDAQLAARFNIRKRPLQNMTLVMTTPVSLGNFEVSSPLARLMAEEMSTWFVSAGYNVKEIRRGQDILFAPHRGEFLLTRKSRLLQRRNMGTELIVTGTYTVTSKHVRFNMRIVHAATNDILAMCSATLPMDSEAYELAGVDAGGGGGGAQYPGHQTQRVHQLEQRAALLTHGRRKTMRHIAPALALSVLLLLASGCSIQLGIEHSKAVPFKASYSVTHYRAQENCEACASYTPSYTNFSTPIQCCQVDPCASCNRGRCDAACPR